MTLPKIDIEKILEQFSNRQKFFVWLTIVGAILFLGGIYLITPIAKNYFDNNNKSCEHSREALRKCNKEYAELATVVRGYLLQEERTAYMENSNSMYEIGIDSLQTLEEIEADIKKDSIVDLMRKMTITKWVEEQGKNN